MKANTIEVPKERLCWTFQRAGLSEEQAINAFPNLHSWLSGEKKPTYRQLEAFCDKFHLPFGYLFLSELPKEDLPFTMFRGNVNQNGQFDLNVYDTVMTVCGRQEWLEEYIEDNEIETCKIIGAITLLTPPTVAASKLHEALDLDFRWAFSLSNVETAVSVLTEHLESIGIFLAYNGVVGNNTKRRLDVESCRGFALTSPSAPYIFVNSRDSKTGQMFTLVHEAVHLMLGLSAGHAGAPYSSSNIEETYCDQVAAEFLVPKQVLMEIWNGEIRQMARRFKVSELVIARRAHDIGLLTDEDYKFFWLEYSNRPINKKKTGKGNFYLTSVRRVGRMFAVYVNSAVKDGTLSYTDAYNLTGLYGKTFDRFMTNNI
ncbi:MAG: ImmA/IrrE family metallo-endopeptidase [Bacteroidales bacterium]|nr:ImmA/IrrE family metallo-endopeptidase [Bacteroidales bacterium]